MSAKYPFLYPAPLFDALKKVDPELAAWMLRIPKTETHLHIEGSLPQEILHEKDPERFGPEPDWWKPGFRFRDFGHFLEAIDSQAADFFTSAQAYHQVVQRILPPLAAQGVCYLEGTTHLPTLTDIKGSGPEVFAAIRDAAKVAPDLDLKINMGMLRFQWASHEKHIKEATKWKDLDIVGIHGPESVPFEPWTTDIFREFKENGKKLEAHAGEYDVDQAEFGGAGAVRHAIHVAGAERIKHGIFAAKDERLMDYMAEHQIGADVCINSNYQLNAVPSFKQHPLKTLLAHGVPANLSTDDPQYTGRALIDEYLIAHLVMEIPMSGILDMAANGITVSYLAPEKKVEHLATIEAMKREWAEHPEWAQSMEQAKRVALAQDRKSDIFQAEYPGRQGERGGRENLTDLALFHGRN